ncbi:MAG: glycoside hydrolase family 127 protein [Chitinispirillaceae bacterium]|nr:glycoside hydrolase family 127 protein [Chitinispirillaceae bacterium]
MFLRKNIFKAVIVIAGAFGCFGAQSLPQKKVIPFELDQVRLLPGPFKNAMDRKCSYLLFLDNDRLLYSFRANYKLSTQNARQYGGWETMAIRGHTLGHVLSALAQAYLSTGEEQYKTKVEVLITELKKCQDAAVSAGFGAGYLAAIPESDVNTLLNVGNIWAPLYNIHKTFAGLLDCYHMLGNTTALDMAKKLGDWSYNKLSPYDHAKYQQFWNDRQSAAGEFGGYNESLAELYRLTGTENYLTAAHFFDHDKLFNPCLEMKDELNGLHANTSIPEIIGALKIYETSGHENSYTIAQNFFTIVIRSHTYINGGNSEAEYFKAPNAIAAQLTDKTCETCNVYNMLKLARELFFFDPDPKYMDYYERALYNQILASQDTASNHGFCTYFQPLRSGGIKTYGNDEGTFYCCDGTGLENHTKYGGSIFFRAEDTLYVNLFIPSELTWSEKNMTVRMETGYPHSDTVRLIVKGSGTMPLKIRAPFWLEKPVMAGIDADVQPVPTDAATYFTLNHAWTDSSVVTIVYPQTIRFEKTPDNANVGGVMYGAQLLAGRYGNTDLSSMPSLNASTVKRSSSSVLEFSGTASTGNVTLIPYYQMHHQRYSAYWNLTDIPNTAAVSLSEQCSIDHHRPEVFTTASRMVIRFADTVTRTIPYSVEVYALNGARIIRQNGMLPSGGRTVVIALPEVLRSPNMVLCSIRAGRQSFKRLVSGTR